MKEKVTLRDLMNIAIFSYEFGLEYFEIIFDDENKMWFLSPNRQMLLKDLFKNPTLIFNQNDLLKIINYLMTEKEWLNG